jgi:hypothetical protein
VLPPVTPDGCRSNLCWNLFWRDLQRDEIT